ncbi:hypothetical protein [uncultured Mediterranean phage uvMED]|nr:hypothetical protein [uncultured Mediterranean phage uvMED]
MLLKSLLRIIIISLLACSIFFVGMFLGLSIGVNKGSQSVLNTLDNRTIKEEINKPTTSINNDIKNAIDLKKVKAKNNDSLNLDINIVTPNENEMNKIISSEKENSGLWCIPFEKLNKRTVRIIEKDLKQ